MFKTGNEFMQYLHNNYGLLEGCRMAEDYLRMSRETNKGNADEMKFCAELQIELNKLNNL